MGDLEIRYVPADRWLVWLLDGWEITWLPPPHGTYSVMVSRPL